MKATAITLGIFVLSIFVFNDSMAQKANYTTPGGWTIGLGGGAAYQKSDLANSKGFGLDLTVGSQLYRKENSFLSVDWKFRFLAGQNKAFDHRINPDATYSNIRYSFFTYDLELGLTLNRLRERTGIVLTGFGGAGLTHGRTFTDLYDAGDNLYDFSSIDPDRNSKQVYTDLVALSDGAFETSLVNKVAILPTAGIFAGYQISRSITIGVEFKTNFYLTEHNSLAGINLDNRVMEGSRIDRNNYVSLGLRWNLRGRSSYSGSTGTRGVPVSAPPPSVHITEPFADTHHAESPNQIIRATIENVSGAEEITFSRNGFPVNIFTYNTDTRNFEANVKLHEGENRFVIRAASQIATAEDAVTITLEHLPEPVPTPPAYTYTSASGNHQTTSHDRVGVADGVSYQSYQVEVNNYHYPVGTRTQYVSAGNDYQMSVGGSTSYNYSYSNPGEVSTGAVRAEGARTVEVGAGNESGGNANGRVAIRGTRSGPETIEAKEKVVIIEKEEKAEMATGIRINPGNSAWQFCLVTPSGTFTRENLTHSNFSYSGTASSLYFMPIAGGGFATVNGQPYIVKSGQYYLFRGNLYVTVGTNNPGAMGQWSVSITSSRAPESGNGNKQPKSPCEQYNTEVAEKTKSSNNPNNSGNNNRDNKSNNGQADKGNNGKDNKSNNGQESKGKSNQDFRSNNDKENRSNSGQASKTNNGKDSKNNNSKDSKNNNSEANSANNSKNNKSNNGQENKSSNGQDEKANNGQDNKAPDKTNTRARR